jgi:hypothetical protein
VNHRVGDDNVVVEEARANHARRVAALYRQKLDRSKWTDRSIEVTLRPRGMTPIEFCRDRREVLVQKRQVRV